MIIFPIRDVIALGMLAIGLVLVIVSVVIDKIWLYIEKLKKKNRRL